MNVRKILQTNLLNALLVILLSTAAATAYAQHTERTLTVLSTGNAMAVADHVKLQLTVTSQDQTATGLFVKQSNAIARLKKTLEGAGIALQDITQQPFHLMPNYEYGQQGTRIIGYRLDTPLELRVDDIKNLPHLIDLAASNGANTVTVGSFGVNGSRSLHEEAMKNAIANARKEATSLAKEMGKTVGDIISVSEMEDAGKPAAPHGSEEEEEGHHETAQPSTLSEKAELQVVFELR